MKTCIRCHQSKPNTTEFFYRYKRYPDGLHRYCKPCWRSISNGWRWARGTKKKLPFPESFWINVAKCEHGDSCISCCWEWNLTRDKNGYGKTCIDTIMHRSHRVAFRLSRQIDTLPNSQLVCHSCDNPPCCNPAHLWLGSHKDNHADRDKKGRGAWQKPKFRRTLPRHFGENHPRAKLTEKDVLEIRRLRKEEGRTWQYLADQFGVSKFNISCIIKRKNWTHLP